MDILGKLPTMSDDALNTLKLNAERWARAGTEIQQLKAADLLPALSKEVALRLTRPPRPALKATSSTPVKPKAPARRRAPAKSRAAAESHEID